MGRRVRVVDRWTNTGDPTAVAHDALAKIAPAKRPKRS
jgi:hypothetical protein